MKNKKSLETSKDDQTQEGNKESKPNSPLMD